ncbi:hypothetical protein [Paraburkholderia tropica]|uniref:hypothetical protein n=1 Tax=Paraburkholderia tropica TaxID=92647 RepID=UPI002AB6914E|nr:hypothetical protein [Paraburkholderia tropica]
MPPFTVRPPVPSAVFEPTVSVPSLSVVPPLYGRESSRKRNEIMWLLKKFRKK